MARSTRAEKLDRSVGQHHPQCLLRAWHPTRVQRRPATNHAAGLSLDLGVELIPLGPGQLPDPADQTLLAVVHGKGVQRVGHRVADGAHGNQLPEESIDHGPAGHGHSRCPLAELGGDLVGLAGQHPGQPVLGDHQRQWQALAVGPIIGAGIELAGLDRRRPGRSRDPAAGRPPVRGPASGGAGR